MHLAVCSLGSVEMKLLSLSSNSGSGGGGGAGGPPVSTRLSSSFVGSSLRAYHQSSDTCTTDTAPAAAADDASSSSDSSSSDWDEWTDAERLVSIYLCLSPVSLSLSLSLRSGKEKHSSVQYLCILGSGLTTFLRRCLKNPNQFCHFSRKCNLVQANDQVFT